MLSPLLVAPSRAIARFGRSALKLFGELESGTSRMLENLPAPESIVTSFGASDFRGCRVPSVGICGDSLVTEGNPRASRAVMLAPVACVMLSGDALLPRLDEPVEITHVEEELA